MWLEFVSRILRRLLGARLGAGMILITLALGDVPAIGSDVIWWKSPDGWEGWGRRVYDPETQAWRWEFEPLTHEAVRELQRSEDAVKKAQDALKEAWRRLGEATRDLEKARKASDAAREETSRNPIHGNAEARRAQKRNEEALERIRTAEAARLKALRDIRRALQELSKLRKARDDARGRAERARAKLGLDWGMPPVGPSPDPADDRADAPEQKSGGSDLHTPKGAPPMVPRGVPSPRSINERFGRSATSPSAQATAPPAAVRALLLPK